MKTNSITNGVRLLVAGVFLGAACLKLSSYFSGGLSGSNAFPRSNITGITVGVLELALGCGLLTPLWRRLSIVAVFGSVVSIGVFVGILLSGYPPSSCGCFGAMRVPPLAHALVLVGLLAGSGQLLMDSELISGTSTNAQFLQGRPRTKPPDPSNPDLDR